MSTCRKHSTQRLFLVRAVNTVLSQHNIYRKYNIVKYLKIIDKLDLNIIVSITALIPI